MLHWPIKYMHVHIPGRPLKGCRLDNFPLAIKFFLVAVVVERGYIHQRSPVGSEMGTMHSHVTHHGLLGHQDVQ